MVPHKKVLLRKANIIFGRSKSSLTPVEKSQNVWLESQKEKPRKVWEPNKQDKELSPSPPTTEVVWNWNSEVRIE